MIFKSSEQPRKRFVLSTYALESRSGSVLYLTELFRDSSMTWEGSILGSQKLAELHERDTQDLGHFGMVGRRPMLPRGLGSLYRIEFRLTHQSFRSHRDHCQAELAALRETDRRRQAQMVETLRVIRDMRPEMSEHAGRVVIVQAWDEGVVGLTRWIEKMESVFNISGCAIENQVKFATCTLLGAALTWWNGQIRTLGPEAYAMTWEVLRKDEQKSIVRRVDKYISGLPDNIYGNVKSARPKTLDETIELANDLMDQKLRTYAERKFDNKRKANHSSRNNHGHQKQPFKRQNVAKVYNMGTGERNPYGGSLPKSTGNTNVANTQKGNRAAPKGNGCFKCGAPGHFKRDCPKLKNKDGGNGNAQGWVYAVGNAEQNEREMTET
ncbi:putative reverse transcriptase domain-containing protein [Tanacetum coccineum]